MHWLRLGILYSFLAPCLLADVVVPLDDVTTGVVVRKSASSQSAQVGVLRPEEQAELLGSVPNWHRVKIANGRLGFVSKRWTRVVPIAAPEGTQTTFTMDAVDVGTGLGLLVRGPDFTLVYDGGSNDDTAHGASNRMLAYVKKAAPTLTTIDHMVLSHPHRDHVELLADLVQTFDVREVWDSGRLNDICGYRAFLNAIHDKPTVKYHNARQDFGTLAYSFKASKCYGQELPAQRLTMTLSSRINESPIPLGQNASMTILHADASDEGSPNENSLVVRLNLGSTRVLLMGDAEAGGRKDPSQAPATDSIEGRLLACCAGDLAARVLVVGHHGSMTSSRKALLDAVGASVYIVSSGPVKYGSVTLPDQKVITEIRSRGQVFRTDHADGACATDANKVGPTKDGQPGGCDNIHLVISDTAPIEITVGHGPN